MLLGSANLGRIAAQEPFESVIRVTEPTLTVESAEVYEILAREFNQTRTKVELVGLTSSVGALLRKQKKSLPDVSARRDAVDVRQPLINDTQYAIFEYEDQRQEVGNAEQLVKNITRESDPESHRNSALNMALLESAAQEMIDRRLETLDTLSRSSNLYFEELIELDMTDRQLIGLADEYQNYIDERVLWIRSGRPITSGFSLDVADAWLISPVKWMQLGSRMLTDVRERFYIYLLVLLPSFLLLIRGRRMRERITGFGETAMKSNCRTILPTLQAVVMTVVVASVWPILCALLAWRLDRVAGDSEFTVAVSHALQNVALFWIAIELLRQTCRPMGLGEPHFR